MDGPVDWWWKMDLFDVYVQASFCQIWSQMMSYDAISSKLKSM